jgi:hypothetical protein
MKRGGTPAAIARQYQRNSKIMQLSNFARKYDSVVFRLPELHAQCSGDKFVV